MTRTDLPAKSRLNTASDVDVRALVYELRRTVVGEVRFRPGDRALYSGTGSNYRQLPIGVVGPAKHRRRRRDRRRVPRARRAGRSRAAAARASPASAATSPSCSTSRST